MTNARLSLLFFAAVHPQPRLLPCFPRGSRTQRRTPRAPLSLSVRRSRHYRAPPTCPGRPARVPFLPQYSRSRPAWRSKAFLPTPQPPHDTQPFNKEVARAFSHRGTSHLRLLQPHFSEMRPISISHQSPPPRPLIPPRKRQKNDGQPQSRPPHHGLPYIPPRTSAGMQETAGPGSPHSAPLPGTPKVPPEPL